MDKITQVILNKIQKAIPPKYQVLIGTIIVFSVGICSALEKLEYLPQGFVDNFHIYKEFIISIAAGFGVSGGSAIYSDQVREIRELKREMISISRQINK